MMKIVVTGGHSGIGLELSKKLLKQGHELALVVRNNKRADEAKGVLPNPERVHFLFADLAVQADLQRVTGELVSLWPEIDGLFNNAGVLLDKNYYSEQQNEMHLEVNVLAPYLLSRGLRESLQKSDAPFIINTATGGLNKQKALDLSHLINPTKYVKLMGAYYQSKLAMMLLTQQLAKEMVGIRMLSVDPGALKTKMTADSKAMPGLMKIIRALFFQPPEKGAEKLFNAAFSPNFKDHSGGYVTGNKVKPTTLRISEQELASILAGIS